MTDNSEKIKETTPNNPQTQVEALVSFYIQSNISSNLYTDLIQQREDVIRNWPQGATEFLCLVQEDIKARQDDGRVMVIPHNAGKLQKHVNRINEFL